MESLEAKYEILETLSGGQAIVYKARDKVLDRLVAIKTPNESVMSDPHKLEKFIEEGRKMARLKDVNVLRVLQFIEQHEIDDKCYLITEWMDQTLEEVLQNDDLDVNTATSILTRILQGLHALHNAGIVHRDLKPSNIYLSADGSDVRIGDLGIASDVGADETLTATPKYIAPEIYQTEGEVDRRSDLYSLGIFAYEMFLGRERFEQAFSEVYNTDSDKTRNARWLNWHLDANRSVPALQELRPDVPEKHARIVERMMAKNPAARFSSADEILREFGEIQHRSSAAFKPLPIPGQSDAKIAQKTWRRFLKPRWLFALTGALIVVMVAIFYPYTTGDIRLADEAYVAVKAARDKAIAAGAEISPLITEYEQGVTFGKSGAEFYNKGAYDLTVIEFEKAIILFEQSEELAWHRRIDKVRKQAVEKQTLALESNAVEPDPVEAFTEAEIHISEAVLAFEKKQYKASEEQYLKAVELFDSAVTQALQRQVKQLISITKIAQDKAIVAGAQTSPVLSEYQQGEMFASQAAQSYDNDNYDPAIVDYEKAIALFEQSEQIAWQRRIEKASNQAHSRKTLALDAKAGAPDPVEAYSKATTLLTQAIIDAENKQFEKAEKNYLMAGKLFSTAVGQALQRQLEQVRKAAVAAHETIPADKLDLLQQYSNMYATAMQAWDLAEQQRDQENVTPAIQNYEAAATAYLAAVGDIAVLTAWKRMITARDAVIQAEITMPNQDFDDAEQLRKDGLVAFDKGVYLQAEPLFNRAAAGYQAVLENVLKLAQNIPGKAELGSSEQEIDAAMNLCQQHQKNCQREWYATETLREVQLKPFLIDPTEVTNQQFAAFVEATAYTTRAEKLGFSRHWLQGASIRVKGYNWRQPLGPDSSYLNLPEHPVVHISQADAIAYCNWREQRLPSEDEWEFSARGAEHRLFPWGNEWNPDFAVWNTKNMSQVKQIEKGANSDGIYDLAGNVWEWTSTSEGNKMVLKGGSWSEANPANLRAAVRRSENPETTHSDDGFRCVRDVQSWPER